MTETPDAARGSDHRRPPFCFQTHDALDIIRAHFTGATRSTALAVYMTFTEVANRRGGADARDGFRATRKTIASHAGVGVNTLDRYVRSFEELGLLEVVREKIGEVNLPNRWAIVDAPGSDVTPLAPPQTLGSPTGGALRARSSPEPKNPVSEETPLVPPSAEVAVISPVNRPASVSRRPVSDSEYSLACQVLLSFNEQAGTRFRGVEEVRKIIGRIREHPDLTYYDHVDVIRRVLAAPWWDGPTSPSVIYGNGSIFERSLHTEDQGSAGVTMKPADAAEYGKTWGPGTPFETPGAARAEAARLEQERDLLDAEAETVDGDYEEIL